MTEEFIIEIVQLTVTTVALLVAPTIAVIIVVGVVSNVLQTVTQIRDQALAFVPKVIAVGIVLALTVPWYVQTMRRFTETIFALMASVGR